MPYEGEFAGYQPLRRIVETEQVKALLNRAKVHQNATFSTTISPEPRPIAASEMPRFILAIDGSNAEVDVKNGYPGAKVGYCTVASVLIDLDLIGQLDENRPVDPREFRKTEQADTIDAALPGTNVVTRRRTSARESFREELYDLFHNIVIDEEDNTRLVDTYEALLAFKPSARGQACPYEVDGCIEQFVIKSGHCDCTCSRKNPLFSTDALRIHERFRDLGTNGEAFGLVMQIWERILLVHMLRAFERRGMLERMGRLAFFVDGPLAVFGPPAWLSAAISAELKRLNALVRTKTGHDLIILGIEKTGEFVTHFEEADETEKPGTVLFAPQTFLLLTDQYIKERVTQNLSGKRYGEDTYFGRKFFYKTKNGARIVANIPFLTNEQDTLATSDISLYPQFGTSCELLDRLVSSRFQNALSPLITAHSHAAIPLHLGAKVLTQLARALMGEDGR